MDVADTVFAPVIAILGAGESAIASLNVAVIVSESPCLTGFFEYVIAAVGEVVSTVTCMIDDRPVFPARSVALVWNVCAP